MRFWKKAILALLIAALAFVLPCSLAQSGEPVPARGYNRAVDYTKVRWQAARGGLSVARNGDSRLAARLSVDAAPGEVWELGAEFIRVQGGELTPYNGHLDVSAYCAWESEALDVKGNAVTLPEKEGVYALIGRFIDDKGNWYTCEMTFTVSKKNSAAPSKEAEKGAKTSPTTVEEKVQQIAAECRAQGFTSQYDIALWLHDWLIYNANYDFNFEHYDADGVLLYGTGVCDSYSKAYCLLLDAFGIDNKRLASPAMGHAWNMVKIEGVWCHVDCTWDDPGTGGDENHDYFGMSDALMRRDHQWSGSYPTAGSLEYYYPLRAGMLSFSNEDELDAILTAQAGRKANQIPLVYIGSDANLNAIDATTAWISRNNWKYGIASYDLNGGDYVCTFMFMYTNPWERPQNHLDTPADAPDFHLDGPRGRYLLRNYSGNGMLLIFGRTTCGNTRNLLSRLSSRVNEFYDKGVEILVSMYDASEAEDFELIEADYPGFHYAYADKTGLAQALLDAAGCPSADRGILPYVFVINKYGKITYYWTDYVSRPDELMAEVSAVATYNPLPEPEEITDVTPEMEPVDAPDFSLDSPRGSYTLGAYRHNGLILVLGRTTCGNTRNLLSRLSGHLSDLYSGGVDVLVSVENAVEPSNLEELEASFPGYHYTYDGSLSSSYLDAVGFDMSGGFTFPCVFVINCEGKITYYHTGSFANVTTLLNRASAVATGNPLPEPQRHADLSSMLNGTGNVNDAWSSETITTAVQSAAASGNAILCIDYYASGFRNQMAYYEKHYALFNRLGISMIVSAAAGIDEDVKAAYPHCQCVAFSNRDFWAMLTAAGFNGNQARYATSLLVERGGRVVAFTNGGMLNPGSCALYFVRQLSYDAGIPGSLTAIDENAFSGAAFRRLDLTGGKLREIRAGAFANCGRLEFVRVPESVTSIGDGAFGRNAIIVCTVGTAACEYARANGIEYICE